jgi:V8-like Glu-specific endopeptidase
VGGIVIEWRRLKECTGNFAMALVLCSLSACGGGGGKQNPNSNWGPPVFDISDVTDRAGFLTGLPVYNFATGALGPPIEPSSNTAPFGILIGFVTDPSSGSSVVTYCSTSHISPGKLITNAHCVADSNDPTNYFVVFFNQSGQQTYTRIQQFLFVGNTGSYDVALLRISSQAASTWDTVNGTAENDSSQINQQWRESMAVWGFDPIKDNYPQLAGYNGTNAGMVFRPKGCFGTRSHLEVTGYNGPDGTHQFWTDRVQPTMHISMDSCTAELLHGNSGSLITNYSNFKATIGVFHWGMMPSKPFDYSAYTYTGTNFQQQVLFPSSDMEFYEVGTAFDYLNSTVLPNTF